MMYKKRLIEQKIDRLLDMFPVVAIIGSRQCGKSTLVKNIRPDWKYSASRYQGKIMEKGHLSSIERLACSESVNCYPIFLA